MLAAPIRNRTEAAPDTEFGDLSSGAFVIPFLPFDIVPFKAGAGVSNASNRSDGEPPCPTSDVSNSTPSMTGPA